MRFRTSSAAVVAASFLLIGGGTLLSGCNQGGAATDAAFATTASGLQYKLFRKGADGKYAPLALADINKVDSAKILKPNHVLMTMQVVKNGKDSVLNDSYKAGMPTPFLLNPQQPKSIIDEPMRLLAAGDSGVFRIPSDSIFTKRNVMLGFQRPKFIAEKSFLSMTIKAQRVLSLQEAQAEMGKLQQAAEAKQVDVDTKALAEYVEKAGLKAEKLPSGVYVAITTPGTGAKPVAGEQVSLSYKGTLLDGKEFDSSLRNGTETPFSYAFSQGQVIPGWDEGVGMLSKGAKATILIPSKLAYGVRGSGPVPPNAPLRFDVELKDIKPAPKTPPMGAVPPQK